VVIPLSFERLVGFLDYLEARLREPSLDPLTIRLLVVSAGVLADALAMDRGQAGGRRFGQGIRGTSM
jgi:hypothetical protein